MRCSVVVACAFSTESRSTLRAVEPRGVCVVARANGVSVLRCASVCVVARASGVSVLRCAGVCHREMSQQGVKESTQKSGLTKGSKPNSKKMWRSAQYNCLAP